MTAAPRAQLHVSPEGPEFSVVVPALDEERCITACLERLRALAGPGVKCETIVVDGGSTDRTCELARPLADRVFQAPGGLYRQLNAGASAARGAVLLFHYADGLLPPGALAAIAGALSDRRVVGGAFRLAFASRSPALRLVALGANARNRILRFGPFGDQSIFTRREAFAALGGFRPDVLLADLDLVRRLRRLGRFRILPSRVLSSPRRWERRGILPTLLAHWRLSAAYLLGAHLPGRRPDRELGELRRIR